HLFSSIDPIEHLFPSRSLAVVMKHNADSRLIKRINRFQPYPVRTQPVVHLKEIRLRFDSLVLCIGNRPVALDGQRLQTNERFKFSPFPSSPGGSGGSFLWDRLAL